MTPDRICAIRQAAGLSQSQLADLLKTGDDGQEWCTTWGRNRAHCDAAAKIGYWFGELTAERAKIVPKE